MKRRPIASATEFRAGNGRNGFIDRSGSDADSGACALIDFGDVTFYQEKKIAAMMVLMIVLLLVGGHGGHMGSHSSHGSPSQATQPHEDGAAKPDSDKP